MKARKLIGIVRGRYYKSPSLVPVTTFNFQRSTSQPHNLITSQPHNLKTLINHKELGDHSALAILVGAIY